MDLDALLTESDPARDRELPGPSSDQGTRLYQQIVRQARPAHAAGAAHSARSVRSVRSVRRFAALVAVTGAVAAGLVAVLVPHGGAGQVHRLVIPRGHVTALELAAETAARQSPDGVPGPGQYLYVKMEMSGVTGSAVPPGTATAQAWLKYDGTGHFQERFCDPGCGGQQGTVHAASHPYALWGFPLISPKSAASLPANPTALLTSLQFYATHTFSSYPGNLGIVEAAGSFLAAAAPPPVRAALYRAVSEVPGIEDLGRVTDRLGRTGQAFGLTQGGLREEIIYDPATSAVLEQETVVSKPGGLCVGAVKPAGPGQCTGFRWVDGEVLSYVVYAASAVVNSSTATAPASAPSG
jgi:hypothetical protein